MNRIADIYENIGGILKLWIVPVEEVALYPEPLKNHVPFLNFTAESDGWLDLNVIDDRSGYTTEKRPSFSGDSYQHKLRAGVSKVRTEVEEALIKLDNRNVIVGIKDGNAMYKLFGTLEHPLVVSFSAQSGNQPPDLNYYNINMEGATIKNAFNTSESMFSPS